MGIFTLKFAYWLITTGGGALGTINVYDRKGQIVRSVRKGLGGHVENVRTSYTFTGAVDTVRVDVSVGYGGSFTANTVNAYGKGKKTGMTLKNGLIDKYLFEEGCCQATVYGSRPGKDSFAFCYYDRDHLGSVREVTRAFECINIGTAYLRTDYYPSGSRLCDGTADSGTQPYKYNGKELDRMHGLCTYDYGARQYDPVTARWDRMDPLCEKYYGISPYVYCAGDPVNFVDPDGNSIIITGKYSEEALNQIQAFVGDGLSLYYHNDYLCYTITDKDKLTQNAKKYIQMIDDTNIDIQISTVDSNQLMVGGAYLGHDVEKNENGDVVYVKAYQSVDPNVLDKADTYSEKGKMITHEVTEAYEGAKIGKKTGKDDKYRIKDNKIQQCKTYKTAHFRASEQNIVQERFISTPSGKAKQYYLSYQR